MSSKHKMQKQKINFLKSLGIAGFLFFLIKGILWLIFGTAIYKWFQSILTTLFLIIFANSMLHSQSSNFSQSEHLFSKEPQLFYTYAFTNKNIVQKYTTQAFFCKLEKSINPKSFQRFSFRLGNHNYCNQLEYGKYLYPGNYR